MKYRLKKETKPTLSTFGKYKAVAVHEQTIDARQIVAEACDGHPLTEDVMQMAMSRLSYIMSRHLRRGDRVRLKDWGMLKLEIESDKVDDPKAFRPKKHIRGVRLHFLPESSQGKPELYQGIEFDRDSMK